MSMIIILLIVCIYFAIVNYGYIRDINKLKKAVSMLLEVIEYYEQQSRKNGETNSEGCNATTEDKGYGNSH